MFILSAIITDHQLKILILYVMKTARSPIPLSTIADILGICDINYFNMQQCITELIDQRHILRYDDENKAYAKMSSTGLDIVEILEKDVPLSLREKVSSVTALELARLRRNLSVSSSYREIIETRENSYELSLCLKDGNTILLELKMYTPTKLQAELIVKNFSDNPTETYKKILYSLIGLENK